MVTHRVPAGPGSSQRSWSAPMLREHAQRCETGRDSMGRNCWLACWLFKAAQFVRESAQCPTHRGREWVRGEAARHRRFVEDDHGAGGEPARFLAIGEEMGERRAWESRRERI